MSHTNHKDYKFSNKIMMSQYRENHQKHVAAQVYVKEKMKDFKPKEKFDSNLFNDGMMWFKNGLSLEGAPEDLQKNDSFVKGFEKAKRLNEIETTLYNVGRELYNSGIPLDQIPNNYRNNQIVLNGYNDEMAKAKQNKR